MYGFVFCRILEHIIHVFVFCRVLEHINYVFVFGRILEHILYVFMFCRILAVEHKIYVFVFCCVPEHIFVRRMLISKFNNKTNKYNNTMQEMIKPALYARSSNLYPCQVGTS